jgi:hypothetical protein
MALRQVDGSLLQDGRFPSRFWQRGRQWRVGGGEGEAGLDFFFLIKGDGVSARGVGCISVVGGRESRWIESQSGDLGGVVGTV